MIAAATASTTASSLVTINEIQPVKISLSLPQSDLPRIQAMQRTKGLTVTVALHDAGGQDIKVPVNFISNAVTNTTGTIELRATYRQSRHGAGAGPAGGCDRGAVGNSQCAIVVPREAVNTGPDGQFVYAVKDGIAAAGAGEGAVRRWRQ